MRERVREENMSVEERERDNGPVHYGDLCGDGIKRLVSVTSLAPVHPLRKREREREREREIG